MHDGSAGSSVPTPGSWTTCSTGTEFDEDHYADPTWYESTPYEEALAIYDLDEAKKPVDVPQGGDSVTIRDLRYDRI